MLEEYVGLFADIGNIIFFIFGFPQLVSTFKHRKELVGLSPVTPLGYVFATIFFTLMSIGSSAYFAFVLCIINAFMWAMQIYWMKPKLSWCWILPHWLPTTKWCYRALKDTKQFCCRCGKERK